MKRRHAVGVLIAALFVALAAGPAGAADPAAASRIERRLMGPPDGRPLAQSTEPGTKRRLADLRDKARVAGKLRVIVGVRAAFAPEGHLSAGERRAQREDIAAAQETVRSRLPRQRAEAVTRFELIPFMALRVDAEELEQLAAMSEVTDIQEDRPERFQLAESAPLIRADAAWAAGRTGAGWSVAVLDSGVDKTHPLLAGAVVSEACYSTTDPEQNSVSLCPGGAASSTATGSGANCPAHVINCEHGTHVAGVVAGRSATVDGIARGGGIIAIKIASRYDSPFDCGGTAPCAGTFPSDQVKALERVYALREEFKIAAVNLSLTGQPYTTQAACDAANAARKAAIDSLRSAGIATVASSGNEGEIDRIGEPGCISSAVSVGATFDAAGFGNSCAGWFGGGSAVDKVTCFSNAASFLDLLAPGASINSSIPGGGFQNKFGTSQAAPHVAGCWAVLKEARPAATLDEVEQALKATGVAVQDWRTGQTKPRIDCKAALDKLLADAPQSFALTVNKAGTGQGTVTGTGIDCGSDCTETYAGGTGVSLTATPASGSTFDGWSGGCTNTAGPCNLTMSAATSVTAAFSPAPPPTYLLTVAKGGTGTGAVTGTGIDCGADCSESYAGGTEVSLTATPANGGTFAGWTGACTNATGPCLLTMNAAQSVSATFTAPIPPPSMHLLTVAKAGTGSGAVAGSGIACGDDCTETYASGASVTLTATPASGSVFTGWSGGCTASRGPCTLTMTAATKVTATFALAPPPATAALAIDYTDIWYTAAESGQGYNLVQTDTYIFVTFFIYGPTGAPTWYVAALEWDGVDSFDGAVYATTGTFFGVPWVPGQATEREVGTASFKPSASNAYQGSFSYSVPDVGSASKSIERQTLLPIPLGGTYVGGQAGTYTGCANAANNGAYEDHFRLNVTHLASGEATFVFAYTGGLTCTLAGKLEQHGLLYVVPAATYTCSNAPGTTATITDITALNQAIAGRFAAAAVGGGCAEQAGFAAVLK